MFQSKRVHFIGIGGVGMSAIAWILLKKGVPVSGSDLHPNHITARLERNGAQISFHHDPANLNDVGLVVTSSAIREDNPEIIFARRKKLPIWRRSDMLAEILDEKDSITVAGSHGKTTTSAMTSMILQKAGLDPTFLVGAEIEGWDGNARLGAGKYVVAEADESDGSLLSYFPRYAIITNVEADHLDYYKTPEAFRRLFRDFLSQVSDDGCAILCADDPGIQSITSLDSVRGRRFYSLQSKNCDFFADNVILRPDGSSFAFYERGEKIGNIHLLTPGRHNVYNALASLGMACVLGVDFTSMKKALEDFKGAKRRFQILAEVDHILIIDDYAHHPTEVASTLNGAIPLVAERGGRMITVFQPHRFSRTQAFYAEFSQAFDDSDIVIITDVYSAGEESIEGVSGELIYDSLVKRGHPHVYYIPDLEDVCGKLLDMLIPQDLVITMGAGNVWKVGEELMKSLESYDLKTPVLGGVSRL